MSESRLWEPFNFIYGPWYRAYLKVGQQTVIAIVQPDMEPGRYFWSVRFPALKETKTRKFAVPESKIGGSAPDLESAKEKAEQVAHAGRPSLG